MKKLRAFLLASPPRPFAERRQRTAPASSRSVRGRSVTPSTNPIHLRGRAAPPGGRRSGIALDIVLTVFFVTLSLLINAWQVQETETHPDESRWMNRAYYARELRDPFGPTWQEYATTIGQPALGSIVMGIGLAIQGEPLDSVAVWDFAYGRDWNIRAGTYPDDELRYAARHTNVVIGALVTGAIYVLGRLLTNRVGGGIAAMFIAWHPLHILLSTQALSDQTLSLMLALIFIAGWAFAKRPTWARAIMLGVLLGLGGSVKLTPLLLAGPLAVFGLIRWWLDRDADARRYAMMLLAQPIIAFSTFVLSYPYLWPDPIGRTWTLFAFRAQEMESQSRAWPETLVTSPLDSLARFGQYLTEGNSTSGRILAIVYDVLGIETPLPHPDYEMLGVERMPAGFDFVPAAAGIVLLVWWVARRGFWTPAAMVALLMGAEAGALVIGMRTDFYRYHLPIVVIMAGSIAVSAGVAWSVAMRLYRRWTLEPHDARLHTAPTGTGSARDRDRIPVMTISGIRE